MTNPIRHPKWCSARVQLLAALFISSCQTASNVPAPIPSTIKEYKDVVEDQLGPIWYRLVTTNEDRLNLGTIKTTFEIPAAGGRIRNLKIISNTSGWMSERIARIAIDKLRAPPIPPSLLLQLRQDHIVFEESFTIFDSATEKKR
jgi:hypothetical protein